MSNNERNPQDLAAAKVLIAALCEERLTAEQAAELEGLVCHNSKIRRMYIRMMHLHAGLYQHASLLGERVFDVGTEGEAEGVGLGDAMVMPALPAELPRSPKLICKVVTSGTALSRRAPSAVRTTSTPLRWPAWVAAAAVLVLAFGLTITRVLQHGRTETLPAPIQTAAVATFNQGFAAEWADGSPPVAGADLSADREYGLKAGYARLTFPGGAVVVVEGPARFTTHPGGDMTLASGKLSAVVPGAATGFTVTTPVATVVDLGTEFGVGVSKTGTEVQVYRGRVSLAAAVANAGPTSHPAASPGQIIGKGDARRVDAAGAVSTIAANPAAFIRPAQFDGWAKGAPGTPLLRWQAYSERLRRDPDLVLYYTFEKHADAPNRLQNEALATFGKSNLPLGLESPSWAPGRWPEKNAMAFDAARHQHLLVSDYSLATNSKLSVATWVNLHRRVTWASIVKNRGNQKGGQFAMGLWADDGDLVARAFCDNGSEVEVREGKSSPLPTNRWVHVVMVADGSTLRLFDNGREVASQPCRSIAPNPSVRSLAIGFRTNDDGTTPFASANAENWDGAFDELAVFHRALTSEQVKEMYEAGKP